ncbi:MAG: long-subunit fatty acid transport protein, partial [Hyphomicrobiaceae bacterium]
GYLRLRFPAGFPFKYTMRGPGIQAMFGAQYHVDDRLSLGLGVRTPGIIFMDGSGPTPEGRRDMDLQIRMPAQVFVGASFDVTPTVELAVSGRWTDSSTLGASLIRVGGFDQLTTPLVPDANDEFRGAVGVTWAVAPKWKLRTGIGYADGIVGDDGASPLLFDVGADVKITSGISYDRGPWTFDVTAGYNFEEHREIDGEEALLVPGHYEASGGVLFLGLRRGLN